MNTCTVEGCDRTYKARGYCALHYNRWRKTGNPGGNELLRNYEPTPCAIDDCGKDATVRGWCQRHYYRWKTHGDPTWTPPTVDVDGMRTCTSCGTTKPIEDYYKHPSERGGRQRRCKACSKAVANANYAANRDTILEQRKAYNEANIDTLRERDRARYERDKPKRIALAKHHSYLRRARIAAGPHDKGITDTALRDRDGTKCYYCTRTMTFTPASGSEYIPRKATVEHLTPLSQGGTHTWDNTVLCCWECNARRGVQDHDRFKAATAEQAKA